MWGGNPVLSSPPVCRFQEWLLLYPVSGPALGQTYSFRLLCNLVPVPHVAFVSLHLSVSGQVPWASIGSLGPGQAHPGVSIETADPGCESLVLENPVW